MLANGEVRTEIQLGWPRLDAFAWSNRKESFWLPLKTGRSGFTWNWNLSLSQLPGTFCSLRMSLSSQSPTSSRCMEKMPRTNRTVIVCVDAHTQDLHKWKTNTYRHFSISSQPLCEGEYFCYLHLIIITIIYNNYCCCCYLQRKKHAKEYTAWKWQEPGFKLRLSNHKSKLITEI